MIRNSSFLLIVLLLSACGTWNNSQFSKRRHLKGHFWNLKKKYKNSCTNKDSEIYAIQQVDVLSAITVKEISAKTADRNVHESAMDRSVFVELRDQSRTESSEEIELCSDFNVANSEHTDRVETNEEPKQSVRPSRSSFTFFDFLVILIGSIFWSGVVGLIITLFLYIFSTIIPWLFYYSLFAVGIPLAAFFILMVVVLLILSKQEKRQPKWE